ncbi:MAG: PAS domain S-box protein [Deltaproteobacteria bacterium]|nr:PAS domain S-box protein [Deltaproteobacteria bacterium]
MAGVIGSAMDAIITVDGEQRIVLFNAAAEKMFRCASAEALGQSLDRFIPARFRAGHHNHIREFGQTKVSKRTMGALGAIFGLRADGTEFPIEASISQLDAEGQPFFTVILRDVTERNRAEEALRASEARFSIAFNASPISSVIVTLDEGRYVAVNDTFLSLTGYSRAEMLGRTAVDLRVWPTPEARVEVIQLLRQQGQLRNYETSFQMKNGDVRTFLMSAELIELDNQPHLIAASVDITERKHAEAALRKSQQLLQAIIDNSMAVIYVKDLAGRYLLANRSYREIFHLSSDAILGKTDYDIFAKEAADAFRAMDERVAAADQALMEEETAPQDDGLHAYLSVKAPLRDNTGKTYAIFGISTDITERKQAEEALRRSETAICKNCAARARRWRN